MGNKQLENRLQKREKRQEGQLNILSFFFTGWQIITDSFSVEIRPILYFNDRINRTPSRKNIPIKKITTDNAYFTRKNILLTNGLFLFYKYNMLTIGTGFFDRLEKNALFFSVFSSLPVTRELFTQSVKFFFHTSCCCTIST
ncbi:MAG: hypothetical protein D3904_06005 [Candidatus Electrothrix sp. EH2]|nr:hypothetical protein [Candidatus Electrothrix sp. EH2]